MGNGGGVICKKHHFCQNSGKELSCVINEDGCDRYTQIHGFKSIEVRDPLTTILNQRHSECAGCPNHPGICKYCIQDNDYIPDNNG